MIRLRMRASLRHDEGVAMLMVIAIGMIVAILAAAMMASVLQNQSTTRRHLDVTSAQGAAEAALDDAVYQLGLVGANGTANWTNFTTGSTAWTQASPHTVDLGSNNANGTAWITQQTTGGSATGNLIIWAHGTYGGNTRTIRALVSQGSPPAFDYSMFASKGIDIHQHGGWLSPQVWTTSVHSNGYIYIDYPSEFNVNSLEAVGNLTLEKGGGKIPSGTVASTGYSWPDPLNGMCYPGGYMSPGGTTDRIAGACPHTYPGNAVINGSVYAGSLTLGSHGIIQKVASPYALDTGQELQGYTTGDSTTNGAALVGSSSVNCATSCNKSSPAGGQVQGTVTVKSGYTPAVVPFPSIDYSTKLRPYAQGTSNASSPSGTNYFTSPAQFLTWATGTTSLFYNASSNGTLTPWVAGNPFPDVILLTNASPLNTAHVWDVNGGSLSLDFGTVLKNVEAATNMTGSAAPTIVVQGDLIVEAGGITLSSGLVVVGADENTDGIVIPYNSTTKTPAHIDTSNTTGLLKTSSTQSGVLAAGGQISSNDYDTDSPWTSTSTYEPQKAAPVYVRGLVYSASWNATTKSSTPQNQHWHNFDPKNLMKIYGAQVGADLHDCNNFSFTYDPIVKTALGFGGGSVKVIDYQELGN